MLDVSNICMRRYLYAIVLTSISLFILFGPRICANVTGLPGSEGLAVKVRKIMGIPSGIHPYLPQLRQVLKFFNAHIWKETNRQFRNSYMKDPAIRRALSSLVRALNTGVNVSALPDRILNSITLGLHYLRSPRKPWAYSNVMVRLSVIASCSDIAIRALSAGDRARAVRYARASLIMMCQNDLFLHGTLCMQSWLNPNWPHQRWKYLSLGITEAQGNLLRQLYRRGVKEMALENTCWKHLLADFSAIEKSRIHSSESSKLGAAYISALEYARTNFEGKLDQEFYLLGTVRSDSRKLLTYGHRNSVRRIKVFLKNWAARIKKQRDISRIDSQSLLRWIKEAQGKW